MIARHTGKWRTCFFTHSLPFVAERAKANPVPKQLLPLPVLVDIALQGEGTSKEQFQEPVSIDFQLVVFVVIGLLVGFFRWAILDHSGTARKQPIKEPTETPASTMASMGRFPSVMGRSPTSMGRFPEFASVGLELGVYKVQANPKV